MCYSRFSCFRGEHLKMKHVYFFVILFLAAVAAEPTLDPVLLKPTDLRYQHVQGAGGLVLTDTWVKASDVSAAARYRPDEEIVYYFFSRTHASFGYPVLNGNSQLLSQTDFDPRRRTAILVHGWLGNAISTFNLVLVRAFLSAGDYNVIVVDWSTGAWGEYATAVTNTVTSGESVARFINWLVASTSASCTDIHLVGFSLGGHMVGVAGRNADCQIDYITSLDPAWPLWILNRHRFRPMDGAYTEVLHTNAGQAGYLMPLGLVDFYANNAVSMPGCDGQECSHDRCFWYFAESLTNGGFTGLECLHWQQAMMNTCVGPRRLHMGGTNAKHGVIGIFHFNTNPGQPFSLG